MRRSALGLAVLGLLACGESPVAPNTDVGLHVWATVSPVAVDVRDSTAVLDLRVNVENLSSRPIRVVSGGPPYVFTGDPAKSRGLWGSIRIANDASLLNAGPNVDWWGDSVYVIGAHQVQYNEYAVTLQQWRAGGWAVAPGSYRVRGWFNGHEGRSATLTLLP